MGSNERREELDRLADELEQQGVPFAVIPEHIYPGMRYITPGALVDSGISRYSQHYITSLIRRKVINGFELAGNVVLDAFGVKQLLEREHKQLRGVRPGPQRQSLARERVIIASVPQATPIAKSAPDRTLTVEQAAEALGCSHSNIKHLIRRRILPSKKHGRRWVVDAQAVEDYQRIHRSVRSK